MFIYVAKREIKKIIVDRKTTIGNKKALQRDYGVRKYIFLMLHVVRFKLFHAQDVA